MMLENLVTDELTGVYNVSLTITFYKTDYIGARKFGGRKLGLGFGNLGSDVYEEPADVVIPVAADGKQGFWFRIENQSVRGSRKIAIPMNARRIVLELYVSSHDDDEFWYSNPPTEYLEMNKMSTSRGNGAYREVVVKIDGTLVGSEVPFPVIYTGGINPFSWDPVVAIGAFDLPSYDFELTPFLGSLLDGESHSFELGVTNSISFWLVNANLHVWVDKGTSKVEALTGVNEPSEYEESREYKFRELDGSFEIEAERKSLSSGWVNSSKGNFTTTVSKKMKFENKIKFQGLGTDKTVEQKVKVKTEVRLLADNGTLISLTSSKREYPLKLAISTVPGPVVDTELMTTSISHELKEKSSDGIVETSIQNTQESTGSMLVQDHLVINGTAVTQQTLNYKGQSGSFVKIAEAADGKLLTVGSNAAWSSLNKDSQ